MNPAPPPTFEVDRPPVAVGQALLAVAGPWAEPESCCCSFVDAADVGRPEVSSVVAPLIGDGATAMKIGHDYVCTRCGRLWRIRPLGEEEAPARAGAAA